ncbi:UNVERIFIED_CONTAM: hypothetical protein FKN15_060576 [Acipenser sinensis]
MGRKRKTLNEYCAQYPDRRLKSPRQDVAGQSALPPVSPAVLKQESVRAQNNKWLYSWMNGLQSRETPSGNMRSLSQSGPTWY